MKALVPRWFWLPMVVSLAFVNPYVRGDGNGYYAWLVSPALDGDLDFENQYRHADPLFRAVVFEPDGQVRANVRTATGHLPNQWSVGPALLWAPWFAAAHLGVRAAHVWDPSFPADGYSWPYRYACAVGTAVYGWLALVLAWRTAQAFAGAAAAAVGTAIAWAATPLPVYQFFLPFHVHALAAFGVAWFVWRWVSLRPLAQPAQWLQWGAIGGVMTMIYQLNGVLLLIAAYELAVTARRDGLGAALGAAGLFAAAALLVWLPQLVGKAVVYGTPWTTGYGDQFFFADPRLWQTAMSAEHGWFSWTPAAAIGVAGLILARRRRAEARVLVSVVAVFFFAVASYQNWHGQSSFGNRFFVSLTGLVAIGLADVWSRATSGGIWAARAAGAAAVALALWNAGLALQWGTGIVPNQGPVDFRVVARNQVTVVPKAAASFLRRYFTSRDAAARQIEERDMSEPRQYKLKR